MTLQAMAGFTASCTGAGTGMAIPFDAEITSSSVGPFDPGIFDPDVFLTTGTGEGLLARFTASVDVGILAALQPRKAASRLQEVGWRVYVDGSLVTDITSAPVSISRSLSRPIQTGTFEVRAPDGQSNIGRAFVPGVLTGLKSITVKLAYRSSGSEWEVPLITNGIADSTPRRMGRHVVDSIAFGDAGLLYADKRVTYQLPAGSGASRGLVLRKLAEAAGVSSIDLSAAKGSINKPIDLVEGDWLALNESIGEVYGGVPGWTREDVFIHRTRAPERTRGPVVWLITQADIVAAVNGSPLEPMISGPSPPSESLTYVKLRGTKQVVKEACGEEVLRSKVINREVSTDPGLGFQQAAGSGTISASGAVPVSYGLGVVSGRINTNSTVKCQTLIASESTAYGRRNPTTARYHYDAVGVKDATYACFLEENSDASIGYRFSHRQWSKLEVTRFSRTYDSDNWLSEIRVDTDGWYNRKRHTRSRASANDPWDTATPDDPYYDLSEGVGRHAQFDSWYSQSEGGQNNPLTREITKYEHQSGVVTKVRTEQWAWARRKGNTYLYEDGEWGDPVETFRLISAQDRQWLRLREGLPRGYVETNYGLDGQRINSSTPSAIPDPPALERADFGTPIESDYPSADEFRFAKAAARFDSQPIEAECTLTGATGVRREREIRNSLIEWAENESELGSICQRLIIDSETAAVSFTVPANAAMNEGDWVSLVLPGRRLVGTGYLDQVDTTGPGEGPYLSRLTVLMPLDGVELSLARLPGSDL